MSRSLDAPGRQPAELEAFGAAARRAVADGTVPGIAAMLADAGGILYQAAFGEADAVAHRPLHVDEVFFLASMTKTVTAVACLQLVEAGRLGLDDDAAALAPEMVAKVLTGFDAEGRPVLREPKRRMTLRHLLTHTSGHTMDIWNRDTIRAIKALRLPPSPSGKTEAFRTPLVFDPGEGWEYGIGCDWAGRIVETVSGLTLEEYFRRHVFAPVGMEDTGFVLSPERRARLVPVHRRDRDGGWVHTGFAMEQAPEFFSGGAGLYGTVGDYVRFLRMLLNDGAAAGGRVLKPETVDLLFANHTGSREWPGMKTAVSALSNDVDFLPGQPKRWSLGFLRNEEDVPGRRRAGSGFWAGLANSYFWVDRKSRLCGVTASAYFPFADPAALDLFDTFERDAYAMFR